GGQFFPGATFTRSIGTGAGQVQITTGTTGFGTVGQDLTINFGGNPTPSTITWGAAGFTPGKFQLSSTSSDHTITVVNPINTNGAVREVQTDNGTVAIDAVLSGTISGSGGFTKSGDGTLLLSAANTYTGETLIGSNGILRVENSA